VITLLRVSVQMVHREWHRSNRIGWLRAAVLGANDGIVSTASLLVGVAAADATGQGVLLAGVAGLVAGAMSMAAGEYVSVSSQADTEYASIALEKRELAADPDGELQELRGIYEKRGLSPSLALQVATELTAKDALVTHAREELGLIDSSRAQPLQAALASAGTFAVGAAAPLLTTAWSPDRYLMPMVVGTSLLFLALLGATAARAGGASAARGTVRVALWGALAMALTAGAGALFGAIA
jgi:VIT1/CCC1 family predicted Fe2+/Mn2+ transporter